MARPEGFSSDEAFNSVWSRRSVALYKAMVAYRYHRRRQRFFDLLDKWTKAFTVIAGASLLADSIKRNVPLIAMTISGFGLLSLVFAYGDRKQSHKELSEAYALLASKIEGTPTSQLGLPFTHSFSPNPRSNRAETDLGKGTAVLNSLAT